MHHRANRKRITETGNFHEQAQNFGHTAKDLLLWYSSDRSFDLVG